jgi:PII-like signaling protein
MTFLLHKGVSGATTTRAMSGFGGHRLLHTPKIEVLAEHLPIRIEFIESAEKVDEVLPALYEMVSDGLIEVQDTTVIKSAQKGSKPEPAHPHQRQEGPAKLLRVFIGEAGKWHEEPLYDALVKKLRMMEIAGATVYRDSRIRREGTRAPKKLLSISRDMPIMLSVVDTAEKIKAQPPQLKACSMMA